MNFVITSQLPKTRGLGRVLQALFTVLTCVSLVIGSLLISLIWLGNGNVSLFNFLSITSVGSPAAKLVVTILLLMPTLCFFGLLSTGALLFAKQWVVAGLAPPTAFGVFIGLCLFLVFVMPLVPALLFVLLLLLLNGGVLWLARWFLTRPARSTVIKSGEARADRCE
jgi:hypothetical protein